MVLIVPDEGELELITKMIKSALSTNEDYLIKLFGNNYIPTDDTTGTDLTNPVFSGYAAVTLTRSNFNTASTLVNGEAFIDYNTQIVWTCGTVGDDVYGYYVEGATSGKVLWAERFDTVVHLTNGDTIKITPSFTLRSKRE